MNKITVFCSGSGALESFKKIALKKVKNVYYSDCDFHNLCSEERCRLGGESKIVLATFSRFVGKTVADVKGNKACGITAFVDGFIGRIDEAVNVAEYIKPLLEVADVFYFTHNERDAERLFGLPVELYRLS